MPNQYTTGTVVPLPIRERLTARTATGDDLPQHYPEFGACWLWTGQVNTQTGYGSLSITLAPKCYRRVDVHRLAWELATGELIPPGFSVLHTCDVRRCLRNDEPGIYVIRGIARPRFGHLWLGTQADNMADMSEKGRSLVGDRNVARTHSERVPRGENHWGAKLTEEDVRKIRHLYRQGMIQRELGALFGVDRSKISDILNGKTWVHVKDH